jgi:uncharacterized protein (DUF1778 family)
MPAKTDRLEIRLTEEQKSDIERAAALQGRSMTDFSLAVLVKEAAEVIRHERELRMSAAAWDAFNEIVDRPAQPVEALANLLRRPTVFSD